MGPLSYGRAFVSINTIGASTTALSIAIRYACNRRQFSAPKQKQEKLLIDYPLTQYRLMPLLAQNIIYYVGGAAIMRQYDQNLQKIFNPKNKIIEQMHAISGVTKAKSAWFTGQVFTQCRQICGGHGYSSYSRFGRLYHDQQLNTTWQGDNHMLLQQTTKYLLKTSQKLGSGKTFKQNRLYFINDTIELPQKITIDHFNNLQFIQKVLQKRITDSLLLTINRMVQLKQQQLKQIDIWNKSQCYYGKILALTFGDLYYFDVFVKALNNCSEQLKIILKNCLKLWIFNILEKQNWGTFLIRSQMQSQIIKLCQWLSYRAVSLIDGISIPNQIVNSVLNEENGQGMKDYVTKLFTGKDTFNRVSWYKQIIRLRGG